ncbi:MAG: hypothetical protein ACTS73_02900 [Arsenophonus sp. NEOnobi-MAG3]
MTEFINALRLSGLTVSPRLTTMDTVPLIFFVGMQWQRYSNIHSTNALVGHKKQVMCLLDSKKACNRKLRMSYERSDHQRAMMPLIKPLIFFTKVFSKVS